MTALVHDRAAQFLMSGDEELDFEAAQTRLETACLQVTFDRGATAPWAQAALLAVARCGARMFRGGVFLDDGDDVAVALAGLPVGSLRMVLRAEGFRAGPAPEHAFHLHVGCAPPRGARLAAWADGWRAHTAPAATAAPAASPGNEVSGVLCAAMALSEAFRSVVLKEVATARRGQAISAWGPDEPGPNILHTPGPVWLLGLGNLGQATAFMLNLLPYAGARPPLVLQDLDRTGPENLTVQILSEPGWIGRRKCRSLAEWLESGGFETRLIEAPFTASTRSWPEGPRILLAGVDNLDTRRWAADAGFDLVIDAGLGASASDAFDLRLHAFPGRRSASEAWPVNEGPASAPVLNSGLAKALAQGRINSCGAITLAGKSVGVPCTALAAAALQVGQLLRALSTGRCCDLIDLSLTEPRHAHAHLMDHDLPPLAAFTTRAS